MYSATVAAGSPNGYGSRRGPFTDTGLANGQLRQRYTQRKEKGRNLIHRPTGKYKSPNNDEFCQEITMASLGSPDSLRIPDQGTNCSVTYGRLNDLSYRMKCSTRHAMPGVACFL